MGVVINCVGVGINCVGVVLCGCGFVVMWSSTTKPQLHLGQSYIEDLEAIVLQL